MSNSFQESVEYLLSLGNEVLAMKLGLENVRKLLRALGDPQTNYLKVQVAGTNGKGSVCAFLNSILTTAGIGVGMFTSPHLISITERVQINGVEISEDDFARLATRVRETSEELVASGELEIVPTFFEQVTAIALLAFAEAKVEIAILETGLGGRLDATTAANAEICAITRIDIDHQQYLGETLAEIAAEKAAIIHECSKVVALRQSREVEQVITGRCREVAVEPVWTPAKIEVKLDSQIAPYFTANIRTAETSYTNILFWKMLGRHQVENAALAVGVAEVLGDGEYSIDRETVITALENAEHAGRLERIGKFLLDGAHNVGGARALRNFLDEFVSQPITMVFGAMNDKNAEEILSILCPKADLLLLTRANSPRSRPVTELANDLPDRFDRSRVLLTENVEDAISAVAATEGTILITGSLYLVGEARRLLKSQI